ncbi:MAG: hypothetical protein JTJ30_12530 [Catenibacterium mitsuokai]|jgi:hypothetical protein|nr:hypothetical protein [Catenibacterium mitsuokai]MBN2932791.1 hypothetical protein [Catenibacterium mitsuokai]DAJ28687.1 MAG TPA: hypothetical protein [Caudoviricetes sp.]
MPSKEKQHFNITLDENDIVRFDTDIAKADVLIKVIATANAATIDILTQATGRDDIADILIHETEVAFEEMKKGGEADESN